MANIASQIKRNRQAVVRTQRNKAVKSELKTHLKKFDRAAQSGDTEAASAAFATAQKKLDKAAQKGVVHRNFAANHKSSMSRRLKALQNL